MSAGQPVSNEYPRRPVPLSPFGYWIGVAVQERRLLTTPSAGSLRIDERVRQASNAARAASTTSPEAARQVHRRTPDPARPPLPSRYVTSSATGCGSTFAERERVPVASTARQVTNDLRAEQDSQSHADGPEGCSRYRLAQTICISECASASSSVGLSVRLKAW